MPRKATPDMDRAKVNRALALSFEPEYERPPELGSELFLIDPKCWHNLLQFTRVDELDVNSSGWQARDFFDSPDLVLMCLEWLIVAADKLVLEEGVRPLPVRLDAHMLDGRILHVVGTTAAEAIVLATAKAKGIER